MVIGIPLIRDLVVNTFDNRIKSKINDINVPNRMCKIVLES